MRCEGVVGLCFVFSRYSYKVSYKRFDRFGLAALKMDVKARTNGDPFHASASNLGAAGTVRARLAIRCCPGLGTMLRRVFRRRALLHRREAIRHSQNRGGLQAHVSIRKQLACRRKPERFCGCGTENRRRVGLPNRNQLINRRGGVSLIRTHRANYARGDVEDKSWRRPA